jgi:hypothetical protein
VTPALFSQFRKQYSSSSLTTELLLVHEGHYVVRATARVETAPLATAMAADTQLEVAEDRAVERLMTCLGIQSSPLIESASLDSSSADTNLAQVSRAANGAVALTQVDPSSAPSPLPSMLTPTVAQGSPLSPSLTTATAGIVSPSPTRDANPEPESDYEPELDLDLALAEPPEADRPITEIPDEMTAIPKMGAQSTLLTPKPAPLAAMPASSLAANALETLETSSNPVDLSDIIAQTDVEMSRLGWSSAQGREYLERTYHKRSRQQLTDEELLEFLLYLESQ